MGSTLRPTSFLQRLSTSFKAIRKQHCFLEIRFICHYKRTKLCGRSEEKRSRLQCGSKYQFFTWEADDVHRFKAMERDKEGSKNEASYELFSPCGLRTEYVRL